MARALSHGSAPQQRLLKLSQAFKSNAVLRLPVLEEQVPEKAIWAYSADERMRAQALKSEPFPWRYCAMLIFLGSTACYLLGYGVFLGFARLLSAL